MKVLILLFISFEALAADYNCVTRLHKLQLKLDQDYTSLIVQDRQTNEYLWNGIIQDWTVDNQLTKLSFDTHNTNDLKLTFKTDDLNETAPSLYGFIDGWSGRGFVNSSIQCLLK